MTTVSEANSKAAKGEGVGTTANFGDLTNPKLENGTDVTNYTTVAHEVQHQYDYDQGNMGDSYDKNGKLINGQNSPAEQRAIKNEDVARDQEGLNRRLTYW